MTIGIGGPDDAVRSLLTRAASAPDLFYVAPDADDLAAVYRAVAGRIVRCPR